MEQFLQVRSWILSITEATPIYIGFRHSEASIGPVDTFQRTETVYGRTAIPVPTAVFIMLFIGTIISSY